MGVAAAITPRLQVLGYRQHLGKLHTRARKIIPPVQIP